MYHKPISNDERANMAYAMIVAIMVLAVTALIYQMVTPFFTEIHDNIDAPDNSRYEGQTNDLSTMLDQAWTAIPIITVVAVVFFLFAKAVLLSALNT